MGLRVFLFYQERTLYEKIIIRDAHCPVVVSRVSSLENKCGL